LVEAGVISFGGPAGQISIMHQELVERRKWISNTRFLHALNYCMLLPGPEAKQLAIYSGHGVLSMGFKPTENAGKFVPFGYTYYRMDKRYLTNCSLRIEN
jgi:hypothetical protein